ncbi:MAG: ATP-grasp domain-containing protein [Methylomonas sp.]
MRILVFEYIVGGGLAGQSLPRSLAAEGGLMLQALIDDLKSVPELLLSVPLDQRYSGLALPSSAEIIPIAENQDVFSLLPEMISRCDAVWPIAPETDGILAGIAEMVATQHKTLLLSRPEVVTCCGDKLATYRVLSANKIPAVKTLTVPDFNAATFTRSVIKPIDGVGCLGGIIVDNARELQQTSSSLELSGRHVIQPYHDGQAISLSCLFKLGKAWLICCNQQLVEVANNRFELKGCLVNAANPRRDFYQELVQQVAEAIPGLWGYIGIDIIETPGQGPLVLEINPRLTTSYVGIRQATGINVAEQVMHLVHGDPNMHPSRDLTVTVTIS